MKSKRSEPVETVEARMLHAVAEYLESQQGFKVLVISADRVQGPTDRQFNFEFVIRFTGTRQALTQEEE